MNAQVALEDVLRRALARAGFVEHYDHVHRRKACRHVEAHADQELRRCPRCSMKLWPKALVRKIRFHDLRHTTASLLLMAGASIAAVQKIMRHRDPKLTMNLYGHLVPSYLHDEVNRMSFAPPESKESQTVATAKQDRSDADPSRLLT